MRAKPAPPSAAERDALIESRRRDLPRPAPQPAPPALGAQQSQVRARREAFEREARITEIDQSLAKEKGKSVRAFERQR